jgi:hypothetical protein
MHWAQYWAVDLCIDLDWYADQYALSSVSRCQLIHRSCILQINICVLIYRYVYLCRSVCRSIHRNMICRVYQSADIPISASADDRRLIRRPICVYTECRWILAWYVLLLKCHNSSGAMIIFYATIEIICHWYDVQCMNWCLIWFRSYHNINR